MQQVAQLFIILGIASAGYFLFPLLGAFRVRRQWRIFREALYASMDYPILTYRIVREKTANRRYRFFGRIEAGRGDDRIWITNGKLSVQVDLADISVFTLSAGSELQTEDSRGIRVEQDEIPFSDIPPAYTRSRQISSFPQGTGLFVAGTLMYENERPVFQAEESSGLLVLIYDGDPAMLLRRAVWAGRQRNEYFNQFTPLSITLSSFTLFILAYIFLRTPRDLFFAHMALTMSLLPAAPFIPPGLFFYSLFRRIWRSGRYLRAERDLLMLPVRRFFSESMIRAGAATRLPDGSEYRVTVRDDLIRTGRECPDFAVRTTRLLKAHELRERRFFAFCGGVEDPFAESILIPGHPGDLSRRCAAGARLREIAAAALFLAALVLNGSAIFILLRFFI